MKKNLSILYTIFGAAGIICGAWLLRLPSERKNALLFGLSGIKLGLLSVMLILSGTCFFVSLKLSHGKISLESVYRFGGYAALCVIYGLVLERVFCFPPIGNTAFFRSLTERLRPVTLWMKLFGFGSLLFSLISQRRRILRFVTRRKTALAASTVVIALVLFLLFSAQKYGWGLTCVSATFYRQGVSLLEGHIVLPLLILFPFLMIGSFVSTRIVPNKTAHSILAVLVPLLIWFGAVLTWRMTPFEGRSYFVPALRLPNQNFYPASDAENYDLLAQSILIGNGFRNGMTVVRPLYVAFLALLHTIAGNDYLRVTDLQIYVLAFFPVCVYAIGKELRRPIAGLLAAVWIILREAYSIAITGQVQVSNVRLFMSDLPTALMISILIWVGLRSFRKTEKTSAALWLGGLLGVCMLIRTQCVILLPVLLLPFLISPYQKRKVQNCIWVFVGTALVFLPWIFWNQAVPNERLTGETSEGNYLLKLYQTAAYGQDTMSDVKQSLPEIIFDEPRNILNAVWEHFYNNEISSFLVLPEREIKVSDPTQFLLDRDLFWYRESARNVLAKNPTLSLFYCVLIGCGVFSAVSGNGFSGLFPLAVHLIYNAGNALAMNSGFRFILPVDWILPFYAALGCACFLRAFIALMSGKTITYKLIEQPIKKPLFVSPLPILGILLAIGLILPGCDRLIPYRFQDVSPKEVYRSWLAASPENQVRAEQEGWDQAIHEGNAELLVGRALYPRFYAAKEGDSGGSAVIKQEQPFSRMVWMFLDSGVHCIWDESDKVKATSPLPDPQDVFLIVKQDGDSQKILLMEPLEKLMSER